MNDFGGKTVVVTGGNSGIGRDGASVINLSSINAYTGMPNAAVYAASKAALNALTRTAA